MPWNDNANGGEDSGKGPWGNKGGDRGGQRGASGGNNNGGRPDNVEDLLKAGRDRLKNSMPGSRGGRSGGRRRGGEFKPPSKNILFLAVLGVLGLWLASGLYRVNPGERAVVTTFGKYTKLESEGLKWHIPNPFQNAIKESVTAQREVSIGGVDGLMLTSDLNIVDVSVVIQWNIKDDVGTDGEMPAVAKYIYRIEEPELLVTAVGQSALREVIGTNRLDPIISNGRALVPEEMRKLMQLALDNYDSGINIIRVNFKRSDPPQAVLDAFRDVIDARSDAKKAENDANAYKERILPNARAQAQRMVFQAEAYKAEEVAKARGAASRFNDIYAEYVKAPEVTRQRMYLETMEGVLGDMNKIIIDEDAGGAVPYLNLNEMTRKSSATN